MEVFIPVSVSVIATSRVGFCKVMVKLNLRCKNKFFIGSSYEKMLATYLGRKGRWQLLLSWVERKLFRLLVLKYTILPPGSHADRKVCCTSMDG